MQPESDASMMKSPQLRDIPPPPLGRTGWPWTEESPQLPDAMPDGKPWPRVSIVTPSYNSAGSIEGTIASILSQGYPDLEHIVVDGGSTDGTIAILHRYPHVIWTSEQDAGQSDALNKGFRKATGDIIGWLNADDTYEAGTLRAVAEFFLKNPTIDMVHGDINWIDAAGRAIVRVPGRELDLASALLSNPVNQQAAFFRRSVCERVGYLRTDLHYAMDYEFWLRLARCLRSRYVPQLWANFRIMPGTKTVENRQGFWLEILRVFDELFQDPQLPEEVRAVERRARGRMHWLAGTALYRAGQRALAAEQCAVAVHSFALLDVDPEAAVSMCRYIEAHEVSPPTNADWIDELMADVGPLLGASNGLTGRVLGLFYATRADYCASQSRYGAVLPDALRAIRHEPLRWLRDRGFLRRSAVAAVRVMRPPTGVIGKAQGGSCG